jgi:DNA-binding transcriptional regulator YbjK
MVDSTERRGVIADAAIGIIARDGLRALTHRAVDREAGLPDGSCSYYARTRRQLLELVVHRLAGRTRADFEQAGSRLVADALPAPITLDETVAVIVAVLDRIVARSADQLARFALVVELRDDPELHALLTSASPIQAGMLAAARRTLEALGVDDPETHARGLVALADGMVHHLLVGSGTERGSRADPHAVFRAYLSGLPRG